MSGTEDATTEEAEARLLLADTTALINFRGEGLYRLLSRLTGLQVSTTAFIVERELEYADTRAAVETAIRDGSIRVVELQSVAELDLWQRYSVRLARGEASALAYADAHDQAFLTDDRDCHTIAVGILGRQRCHRSCRLLCEALAGGMLDRTQADALFLQWLDEEFRMPWNSLAHLWHEVFPGKQIPG